VRSDDRHGQLAHIHVPGLDDARRSALEQGLAGFAVRYALYLAD